jgi:hypothetical protein
VDKILTAEGLRVRCIDKNTDQSVHDQACCVDAVWHGSASRVLAPWRGRYDVTAQDVLVLVTEQHGDAMLGMISASERHTGRESFLLLEAAYVAPAARGGNLLQRMIAAALLHVARMDRMPAVIAACTQSKTLAGGLLGLSRHIATSSAFPAPDSSVIGLAAAGLARRIARVLCPGWHYAAGRGVFSDHVPEYQLIAVTLDPAQDARIAADARRLYQRRPVPRAFDDDFVDGHDAAALPAIPAPRDGMRW